MWRSIYQGGIGPFNGLLGGRTREVIRPWLRTDRILQSTVLIPETWSGRSQRRPVLAAVNGVSRDLLDAATVDGATPVQEFRYVVAPASVAHVAATTLAIAGAVSQFLYPLILTRAARST